MNGRPLSCLIFILLWSANLDAQLSVERRFESSGLIRSMEPGVIEIEDENKKVTRYLFQRESERAISFDGKIRVAIPAKIKVTGKVNLESLPQGTVVAFETEVKNSEQPVAPVSTFDFVSANQKITGIQKFDSRTENGLTPASVVASLISTKKGRATLFVPNTKLARKRMSISYPKDATVNVDESNMNLVATGDKVVAFRAVQMSNGDKVITEIRVELQRNRPQRELTLDELLANKFRHLSDDPVKPRDVRSQYVILHTDISERQAQILLAKLDTMIALIAKYYGVRPGDLIECYVVRDLSVWPTGLFPAEAENKIREPAGVTLSRSLGRNRKSIVYSCDDHGVAQHEAVHAFCFQNFGSTGPTWYSEGMAEMGQYWRKDQLHVSIDQPVIDYLTNARQKKLLAIVAAGQITGDSWQAYAWRWALCHLLANNPNYSGRFRGLGIGLMKKQNVSFESIYGDVAPQVSFEYDQFVENFGNGYRADLCAWNWKVKPKKLRGKQRVVEIVKANRGWQATKLMVEANRKYDFATIGNWQLSQNSTEISADGESGRGKLVGAILAQDEEGWFKLSKPFDLGAKGSFTAEKTGQLCLRCGDRWTDLANNKGEIKTYLRISASK